VKGVVGERKVRRFGDLPLRSGSTSDGGRAAVQSSLGLADQFVDSGLYLPRI
jgi:hypothetical protein